MMDAGDYTWVLAVGFIMAMLDAYAIGANDVANSFATSVGSRSLTLRQACFIALFTEFLGAVLLGANTAETIRSGILKTSLFTAQPELLMLAMMCAVIGSSTWVLFATRMGWPVSTTHSIVGAIIGTGIAAFGVDAIDWSYDGVSKIVTSWFLSPFASGIISAIIFLVIKFTVLRAKNSYKRALLLIPLFFLVTIAINVFFIVFKGAPSLKLDKNPLGSVIGVVIGISVGCAILAHFILVPFIRRRVESSEKRPFYKDVLFCFFEKPRTLTEEELAARDAQERLEEAKRIEGELQALEAQKAAKKSQGARVAAKSSDMAMSELKPSEGTASDNSSADGHESEIDTERVKVQEVDELDITSASATAESATATDNVVPLKSRVWNKIKKAALHGLDQDVVTHERSEQQLVMLTKAAHYENRTEETFSFLQVFTASAASLAHGSNDVANAIGPLAAMYYIYKNGAIAGSSTPVEVWLLAIGGICINIGLLTYGYNIMRSLGNKITYHSPSRGFSMELGAVFTVLTASKLGLPISTTHCITGSTAAVGLCNGNARAINWRLLAWCFFSWIITLPIAGLTAGLLYSAMLYAPHKA